MGHPDTGYKAQYIINYCSASLLMEALVLFNVWQCSSYPGLPTVLERIDLFSESSV